MRALLLLLCLLIARPAMAEIPAGDSRLDVPEPTGATQEPLTVWLHRAAGWHPGRPVLVVMHGVNRNGEDYRRAWVDMAERHGVLLAVPEFSKSKYPGTGWYNFGGVLDEAGSPRPREAWSFYALDRAMAAVQREAGGPAVSFTLYGHSAGAQFVHRYLLLTGAPAAGRIIIANGGSYTLPMPDRPYPEGAHGVPMAEDSVRAALRRPVMIALGEADTDPNSPDLPKQPWSMAQGSHRFARGWFWYDHMRRRAEALRTPFAWQVVTVPGVGHSNAGMAQALGPLLFGR